MIFSMPKKIDNAQQAEEKDKTKVFNPVNYTEEELQYRGFLLRRLESARDQRNEKWDEFDGMDYLTWYESNAKAGNSYNPPKTEKNETKIVTGTTLEKENSLLNATLNLNLTPNIMCFDAEDMPVVELGTLMENLVKKSRQLEKYDDVKRRLIYKELYDQGTCFVEELTITHKQVEKELSSKLDFSKLDSIKWSSNVVKSYEDCECNLIPGSKVFLGNIKEFNLDKQPFVFTVEYLPRSIAQKRWGSWERWNNIPFNTAEFTDTEEQTTQTTYRRWRLFTDVYPDYVEVVKYQDQDANEYMLILNGEMMLPVGFPLSAISGDGKFSISKGDIEPISWFFAYSKAFPAKVKVPQAVLDEFLRLLILKAQKSFLPSYAYKGSRILNRKIFNSGEITPNLDPNDLGLIGNNDGISNADVGAFQLVKGVVDEMTVSSQFQGLEQKGKKTATQALEDKKQNLMKIGMAVLGVVALEVNLTERRIRNILSTWTKSVDKRVDDIKQKVVDVYRSFSMEDDSSGINTLNSITFTPDNVKSEDEVTQEAIKLSQQYNKPVNKIYVNPEILRSLRNTWFVSVTPTEKETSELRRQLFIQNVVDAARIWGIQQINLEGLKSRFCSLIKEDENTFFIKQQQQGMLGQQPVMSGQIGGQAPANAVPIPKNQLLQPNMNTLAGQAA